MAKITRIEAFLRRKRWSYVYFAELIGVSKDQAWRICLAPGVKNHSGTRQDTAEKIAEVTGGAINAENMHDDAPPEWLVDLPARPRGGFRKKARAQAVRA